MRRQATAGELSAGGIPEDRAGRLRLDPFALPVRYSALLAGRASEAAILLDRHQAVIHRPLPGATIAITVPMSDFRGVAVRFETAAEGEVEVFVELRHRDPALTIPLAIASDPADIAADWQAFGRQFGLPLLLVRSDGTIEEPVAHLGKLNVQAPAPRRHHSFFADRRPRFLVRRKVGRTPDGDKVNGRELFARD